MPDSANRSIASTARRRAVLSWLQANWSELGILALLTVAALVPRVVNLVGVPPGLHGDEATTGIRVRALLHGTRIGPFDPLHGLGQPAGMEYLTAAFVKVFGNSILTIRLPMALLGAATVPLTYLLMRALRHDRMTALIAATLLAFMSWHIHFSRIALPPVSLPFFEVLTCLLFVLAVRSSKWWQFALAGAALGMGAYTYSSYDFFLLAVIVFAAYWLITQPDVRRRALLLRLGVMFVTTLIVASPMIVYIVKNRDSYFSYPRAISMFRGDEYKSADGALAKIDVVADAGKSFVQRVSFDAAPDFSDGSGSGPMLDTLFSMLLGLGILLALRRWRQPGAVLPLLILLILPWAGILTLRGGIVRRVVGVTPFLAMLAALPLGELIRRTKLARPLARGAACFVVASVVICVAVLDLRAYFVTFPDSSVAGYVFGPELVAASNYIETLPDGTMVYFYSDRWSFQYETRRYLLPELKGEDRSNEFGTYSLKVDRSRPAVMVFLGDYVEQLQAAERLYPDGQPSEKLVPGQILYRALYLPQTTSASPTILRRDAAPLR